MTTPLFEEFSHNHRYKFQVHAQDKGFVTTLYAYQPEWKDFSPVDNMSQENPDQESAVKLGRALLALLEQQ